MDERILARPERKAHDTRRSYLDKQRAHLKELKKLIDHWQVAGWSSPEQEQRYREYENALIVDVERLDSELLKTTAKGGK